MYFVSYDLSLAGTWSIAKAATEGVAKRPSNRRVRQAQALWANPPLTPTVGQKADDPGPEHPGGSHTAAETSMSACSITAQLRDVIAVLSALSI